MTGLGLVFVDSTTQELKIGLRLGEFARQFIKIHEIEASQRCRQFPVQAVSLGQSVFVGSPDPEAFETRFHFGWRFRLYPGRH